MIHYAHRISLLTLTFLVLFETNQSSPARAFNCSLAKTATEKAICASPDLNKDDQELNTTYRKALTAQAPTQKEKIKQAQRAWIKENDSVCHGDVNCLKKRYKDRIAVLEQITPAAAPAATSNGTIHYTIVAVKKNKPYEITLSYPKFEGRPVDAVAKLNAWVKSEIVLCHGPSKENKMSYIDDTLKVLKFTDSVVVIRGSDDYFCEGNAYPNHGSQDFFVPIATGSKVSLWDTLPKDGQQSIIQRILTASKSLAPDDECKNSFSQEYLQNAHISFGYKDQRSLSISPEFPHVIQACEDDVDVSIAISDLKKLYPPQSPAVALLDALER
jgi:uncharacterized protein